MPSHYRGIDDESHIWRIDVENESRPSKRQRREIFEKYGIDCDTHDATDDIGSGMNKRKATSFSCSSEEEDNLLDASSSLESSSDTMTVEDYCCEEKDHHESFSVEGILQHYIRSDNDMECLREGLDKLLDLIGAKKNNNAISKHRHRIEMLDVGGHWMITNLLAALTQRENGYGHGHGHGHGRYEYEHNSNMNMDAMDVTTTNDDDNNNNTVVEEIDDNERVVAVVARSCQILRELLSMNQQQEAISSTTSVAKVRYQIYCAGGLDAVVSALKRFPTSFDVQLVGCQCLSHLVSITMINNLYQATDKLNIIVRLLGCGMRNTLQDHNNGSNSGDKLFLSKTQSWQLYFVVADIVRSVVKQTSIDSTCRSEVIRTVKKYFISGNGNDNDNRGGGGRHRRNSNEDDTTMAIDECIEDGIHGIGRHMYEHLMTILVDDEEDIAFDAGGTAAAISMSE